MSGGQHLLQLNAEKYRDPADQGLALLSTEPQQQQQPALKPHQHVEQQQQQQQGGYQNNQDLQTCQHIENSIPAGSTFSAASVKAMMQKVPLQPLQQQQQLGIATSSPLTGGSGGGVAHASGSAAAAADAVAGSSSSMDGNPTLSADPCGNLGQDLPKRLTCITSVAASATAAGDGGERAVTGGSAAVVVDGIPRSEPEVVPLAASLASRLLRRHMSSEAAGGPGIHWEELLQARWVDRSQLFSAASGAYSALVLALHH
jgi:hypothetical protein